jgi:hypothetical protein
MDHERPQPPTKKQKMFEEPKRCKWQHEHCGRIIRTEHHLCWQHRKEALARLKREKRKEINRLKMEEEEAVNLQTFIELGIKEQLQHESHQRAMTSLCQNYNYFTSFEYRGQFITPTVQRSKAPSVHQICFGAHLPRIGQQENGQPMEY